MAKIKNTAGNKSREKLEKVQLCRGVRTFHYLMFFFFFFMKLHELYAFNAFLQCHHIKIFWWVSLVELRNCAKQRIVNELLFNRRVLNAHYGWWVRITTKAQACVINVAMSQIWGYRETPVLPPSDGCWHSVKWRGELSYSLKTVHSL